MYGKHVSFPKYVRTVKFVGYTSSKLFLIQNKFIKSDHSWLCKELTSMGPVYIKLGQIVSSRKDVFPTEITTALTKMQDNVEYMEFEQVNEVFKSNFDVNITDKFDKFSKIPIASASIGQVHKAKINNINVAVKVMKPNIKNEFLTELEIVINVFEFIKRIANVRAFDDVLLTLNELLSNVRYETDFLQEMNHMMKFREMLSDNEKIVVPRVYKPLCSKHILTMEYVPSIKITDKNAQKNIILAQELMSAFVTLLTNENYLHCDPHPGNIGIDNIGRIVLYDYGMVKKFNLDIRMYFKKILIAIINRNTDDLISFMLEKRIIRATESNANIYEQLSQYEYIFITRFLNYVYVYLGELDPIKLGVDLTNDSIINLDNIPFEFDTDLIYLFKTFSTLEGVCKQIDPNFNYLDMIEEIASDFLDFDLVFEKISFDIKTIGARNEKKNDIDNTQMNIEQLNKTMTEQQTKYSTTSMLIILANAVILCVMRM